MPQLMQAAQETKKLYLPSTENLPEADRAWVLLDMSPPTAGDLMGISSPDITPIELAATMLVDRIKEWNFTQADGTPCPITLDWVKELEIADYVFLQQQVTMTQPAAAVLDDSEKKA